MLSLGRALRYKRGVQIRLLLGPAGSGKTHRCLDEIAARLSAAPEGPPLYLLAPKQSTYQLERQLLSRTSLAGYTRLHVVSLERFARSVFLQLGLSAPKTLDEEGRLMVLRSILSRVADQMKLFRASARLAGFAQQVSLALHELKHSMATPELLEKLAERCAQNQALSLKLQDLAMLMRAYEAWLVSHELKDSDYLLEAAANALRHAPAGQFQVEGLWVDGFGEWTARELDLLSALVSRAASSTISFCLDGIPGKNAPWLSRWSSANEAFKACRAVCESLPGADVRVELISRHHAGRFAGSPLLAALERHWSDTPPENASVEPSGALQLVSCDDAPSEVHHVARQIRRYVREGGRYRDVMVLARGLDLFHEEIHRTFSRFEIPFFLDRRESVCHHPMIELTRSALRLAAFDWKHEDLFAALKSGLTGAEPDAVDRLENAALERGWEGEDWTELAEVPEDKDLTAVLLKFRKEALPPFARFTAFCRKRGKALTGAALAEQIRKLWADLDLERRLREWTENAEELTESRLPSAVHSTVWTQGNAWLENLEIAFPTEPLAVRDWLPIVDAGLGAITVGLIPPALDQVLVGAVDRSRNPEAKITFVLGFNEGLFPAKPPIPVLLNDADREELERYQLHPGSTLKRHLAREQHFAYVACTRATERLVLCWSRANSNGEPMNPSPFVGQLQRLVPGASIELFGPETIPWQESEHESELLGHVFKQLRQMNSHELDPEVARLPLIASAIEMVRQFDTATEQQSLCPETAGRLYGPKLRTSVSRLEQFAACPFKFFVHSGLRAQERRHFELDAKEKGTFQHDVLARFHAELTRQGKRWRDLTVEEAKALVAQCADFVTKSYREGLFETTDKSRFVVSMLVKSLQEFIVTIIEWMHRQYLFDPHQVELPFGEAEGLPPLTFSLDGGNSLELSGRIDRVDLCVDPDTGERRFVVIDYKSSRKSLNDLLLANGLQLQLLTYASVLRRCEDPGPWFGPGKLAPAGAFYVSLKPKAEAGATRDEALDASEDARKGAYKHAGRFDFDCLGLLDARKEDKGDQFNYRLKQNRTLHGQCREPLSNAEFLALLDDVEETLVSMGKQIFEGKIAISPYKNSNVTACDECEFCSICRVDRWTQKWRVLRPKDKVPVGT